MSFIKRGDNSDGKITDIIDEDGLTEDQKKSVKKMSEQKTTVREMDNSQGAKK